MSTYEPGRLYLIDLDGETYEARYFGDASPAAFAGFVTRDGRVARRDKVTTARLAVVLDPEDEDVKALLDYGWSDASRAGRLAAKIRAQITPPAPSMEEPMEWRAKVTDDRGRWLNVDPDDPEPWQDESGRRCTWDDMQNPRKFENPREKPATGPQSDEQGSGSGIGRVSESEAVEGGLDAWGKRMRAFGDSL